MHRSVVAALFLSALASAPSLRAEQAEPTLPAAPIPYDQTVPAAAPALDPSYLAWRDAFTERAVTAGFDRAFVTAQLAGVAPVAKVLDRDTAQPEFAKPISDYIRAAVSDTRVAEGVRRRDANVWARDLESRYGVPAEIVIAVWAQESAFGKIQGDHDVIAAFATLAWDGRRRDWAEAQLLDAFRIIRDRGIPRERLKGSWAGAMGQPQFIPEAYLKLAQDGDGDGRADIWGSDADALASAANHLKDSGWKPTESWAVEVAVPAGFDWSVAEGEKHPPAWWEAKGVRRADRRSWAAGDWSEDAALLVPAGANGPAFLAFPNHYVIRKYNNSVAYALAIGLLADAMRGAPPLSKPWPYEVALSRDQRLAAQTALQKLGYPIGEIDGVIGSGTRSALRSWQKTSGLVADGYLDPATVERLKLASGLTAAASPVPPPLPAPASPPAAAQASGTPSPAGR
jgi:lytic murein transglycosylase